MEHEDVKIFTTYDSFEADQVTATLEYYDIPSYKRVAGSGQYIGILMGHMTTHEISIYVSEKAAAEAVDILIQAGFLREEGQMTSEVK